MITMLFNEPSIFSPGHEIFENVFVVIFSNGDAQSLFYTENYIFTKISVF